MSHMFWVRSSPCSAPYLQSSPSFARCMPRGRPPPPATRPAPRPAANARTSPRSECPPFDSRQTASAFDQPLSFDTSSVTNMAYMFSVRSFPCSAPNLHSSPLPRTLRAPRSPAASRLQGHTSCRTACPPFDSRQYARAFDQPLSFDTSSVTTMASMFSVRSSPCPAPYLQPSPPLHAASPAVAHRLPPSRPGPRPAPHALLSTLGSTQGCSTSR
eukprot:scaffold45742_cov55-Phaeocystis_antarctica.AAC.3